MKRPGQAHAAMLCIAGLIGASVDFLSHNWVKDFTPVASSGHKELSIKSHTQLYLSKMNFSHCILVKLITYW